MPVSCQGGAVVQLVALGLSDAPLTGSPSVTFWRHTHSSYTNFAIETQEQQFTSGTVAFGSCPKVNLDRVGDLIYWMYLVADLPGIALGYPQGAPTSILSTTTVPSLNRLVEPYWTQAVGQALVQEAAIFIGGQCIDQLWSEFLYIWEELSGQPGKKLVEMTGNFRAIATLQTASRQPRRLYVPLPFWFTMNSGLALPIVSLQFHSISISVQFRALDKLLCLPWDAMNVHDGTATGRTLAIPVGAGATLWQTYRLADIRLRPLFRAQVATDVQGFAELTDLVNTSLAAHIEASYVYLDQTERSMFAQGAFEHLYCEHQMQSQTCDQAANAVAAGFGTDKMCIADINFNHPVAEMMWVVRMRNREGFVNADSPGFNSWFNFGGPDDTITNVPIDPVMEATLKLNNTDRFSRTEGRYFRLVQPYQHHTNIPVDHIYCYSFALQPEDIQPSGSANFSRIDTVKMELKLDGRLFVAASDTLVVDAGLNAAPDVVNPVANSAVTVMYFGINWNTIRYKFGLGGKRFSS